MFSVRPKGVTAKRLDHIFCEFFADIFPALLAGFGRIEIIGQKLAISAKKTVSAKN